MLFLTPCIFSSEKTKNDFDQKLYSNCLSPTVKISDKLQKTGGSGFIVRSVKQNDVYHNVVLTASHVVEDEKEFYVSLSNYENGSIQNETSYPVYIHATEPEKDLAVGLFISEKEMPVVELEFDAKVYVSTEVFSIGCALLDDPRLNSGFVTQPKTIKPIVFKDLIRTSCFSFSGDSGGPLFLKNNYRVIGVCRGIRSNQSIGLSNISYFQSINELKEWDKKTGFVLKYVYDNTEELPKLPFIKLGFRKYNLQIVE